MFPKEYHVKVILILHSMNFKITFRSQKQLALLSCAETISYYGPRLMNILTYETVKTFIMLIMKCPTTVLEINYVTFENHFTI